MAKCGRVGLLACGGGVSYTLQSLSQLFLLWMPKPIFSVLFRTHIAVYDTPYHTNERFNCDSVTPSQAYSNAMLRSRNVVPRTPRRG